VSALKSQRVNAEAQPASHNVLLEQEQSFLRIIINHLPHYIYIKDKQSRFIDINEACLRVLGTSNVDEVIGKTDFDFYPQANAQRYLEDERAILASGQALINHEEIVVEQDTQRLRWVLTTKVPYFDKAGNTVGIIGISRDITELKQVQSDLEQARATLEKQVAERTVELRAANEQLQQQIEERQQAERALQDERNLLRTLMDNLLDEVYVKDRQSRFLMANRAVTRTADVASPDEMIGKSDFDFFPQDQAQKSYEDDQQVMQTGQPIINQEEHFVHREGGSEGWLLTTKIPLRNVDGEIVGVIGMGRDITKRKTTEMQAMQVMLDKERLKLMQAFIGNMSHDVRSPLTVIRNNLYLVEHLRDDPEEHRAKINVIHQQADLLERFIQDILTISRLDQLDTLDRQPVDLNALLEDLAQRYETIAGHKNIQLSTRLHELPRITGDRFELERAIVNIVENAINYTLTGGKIIIDAYVRDEAFITIAVQDTGIGIHASELENIFKRFYRVDKARNAEMGSAGLGLSIARTIIEMHGGHIDVESEPGVGTTFYLRLPRPNND
jgi:PAS domain S-box-containing protein